MLPLHSKKLKSSDYCTKTLIVCIVSVVLAMIGCGSVAFWYFYRQTETPQCASSTPPTSLPAMPSSLDVAAISSHAASTISPSSRPLVESQKSSYASKPSNVPKPSSIEASTSMPITKSSSPTLSQAPTSSPAEKPSPAMPSSLDVASTSPPMVDASTTTPITRNSSPTLPIQSPTSSHVSNSPKDESSTPSHAVSSSNAASTWQKLLNRMYWKKLLDAVHAALVDRALAASRVPKTGLLLYIRKDGETHALDVLPDSTVRDVKQAACNAGFISEEFKLEFAGEPLSDGMALADVGIGAESTLNATLKPNLFEISAEDRRAGYEILHDVDTTGFVGKGVKIGNGWKQISILTPIGRMLYFMYCVKDK